MMGSQLSMRWTRASILSLPSSQLHKLSSTLPSQFPHLYNVENNCSYFIKPIVMNFPLSPAFTESHRFGFVVFSLSVVYMYIFISFLISSDLLVI